MITTHLKGGLGNQMFQYACGYALAKEYNCQHELDISYYSSIPSYHTKREFELLQFNISSSILKNEDKRKQDRVQKFLDIVNSKFYTVFTSIYPIEKYFGKKNLYLDGYFQSEKFFVKYREDILKEFTLQKELKTKEFYNIANEIKEGGNTISVHIRRGDYVTDKKTAKHHGVLDNTYYKEALDILKAQESQIYFFSDDAEYIKTHITSFSKNVHDISKYKFSSAQEMILMSLCKHNIIANSSFSWWGAWLNQNNDKVVIAPKKWTRGLLPINTEVTPKSWHRL